MQKSREDGGLEVQELSSFVDPDPGFITGAGLILRSCSLKSAYGYVYVQYPYERSLISFMIHD